MNSSHKGQWHGALVFSLICIWINDWVNNRETGDLRRQRGHYDVIVMKHCTSCRWGNHAKNPHTYFILASSQKTSVTFYISKGYAMIRVGEMVKTLVDFMTHIVFQVELFSSLAEQVYVSNVQLTVSRQASCGSWSVDHSSFGSANRTFTGDGSVYSRAELSLKVYQNFMSYLATFLSIKRFCKRRCSGLLRSWFSWLNAMCINHVTCKQYGHKIT